MSAERKRLVLALAVIFALNIFIIALAQSASADLYKKGSNGETVSEIQTRLKNWGYYDGAIDGVYGSRTEAAVRWFQQKNGLTADGQVGDQTLAALGISPSGGGTAPTASQSGDLYLLARLISAESVLSQQHLRRHLPARGLLLPGRRPVQRARGRERLPRRPGGAERLRPQLWRDLLL